MNAQDIENWLRLMIEDTLERRKHLDKLSGVSSEKKQQYISNLARELGILGEDATQLKHNGYSQTPPEGIEEVLEARESDYKYILLLPDRSLYLKILPNPFLGQTFEGAWYKKLKGPKPAKSSG